MADGGNKIEPLRGVYTDARTLLARMMEGVDEFTGFVAIVFTEDEKNGSSATPVVFNVSRMEMAWAGQMLVRDAFDGVSSSEVPNGTLGK